MSFGARWLDKTDDELGRAWLVNGMLLALARCADEHDPETNVFARAHRAIRAEMLRRAKERHATTR